MTQSILLLGAGELGMAVLEALAKHPRRGADTKLAVLLRQSTIDSTALDKKRTTQHIRELGASFEAADIAGASIPELASIFQTYGTVISCTGMGLPPGTQTKITKAVLEAGVPRYIPWQFGMDYDIIGAGSSQDLFDEQLAVRALLRGQDRTRWTIVSTGVFMSFLLEPAFGVVDIGERTVRGLGSWETRITTTTPEDIGRVTAEVALEGQTGGSSSGTVLYTAGDTVSYAELADKVEAHFGGAPFKRELWDGQVLKRQMEEDPTTMVKYRDTFAQGRGVAWDKVETVNYQRGIPMMDVEAYLKTLKRE
ncbi:Isoflavone reductase P3-like protein [Hapsidospora chrysogenum ATCC 11550]|uniref:Isoflavone reductase P3-like protein n=1 Tax=Hapsidospora chrysogenum (strain ATCC 11550 / CBS 779.69 / DSM 880 / IAM 14645 / JCM 23072 / IMI 49137) TaxID=857340 RepID=A0A086T851_HAPC1|nr:Isoflavone reductase P3-like protein [Hapsidospora chrysogenum ATCC 11550]